jgi:small subunit ribosomal protein S21
MEVSIHGKNFEGAIRAFRKKTQKEGVVKDCRRIAEFEKPSKKKKRKQEESVVRRRKLRKGEFVF